LTAALRERVAEAARRMSALLVTDLSLEDVFASFCDLLGSFVGANAISVVLRDGDAWVRLSFDGEHVKREAGVNLPYNDPTVATVAFGRTMIEVDPARFSMPLAVGDENVGAVFIRADSLARFDDSDAALVESLAPYLAVAIRQRWLLESVARERFRAEHDELTNLPNRTLFTERLERALVRAHRSGGHVGVLYVDLDGFKPINDKFGHEAGDAVLRVVARRLRRAIRETDTAARLGGDEFGVVLEEVRDDAVAAEISNKAVTTISKPMRWEQHLLCVGASVGRSISPQDGTSAAALVRRADGRMYRSKRALRV
jgi:diguanylate cyclase (GGDEF)-like protein